MCDMTLDFNLPCHFIIPLVFFITFSFLPAAIWAGAITPVITTKTQIRNFSIPQYGPDPHAQFRNQSAAGVVDPNITRTALGSFSYNPGLNIIGSMLDEASLATAPNSSFQTHRKLDNSGFAFYGRSYGIGASVGLATLADSDAQQYTFYEDGYMSNITCWYDNTMDFHIALLQPSNNPGLPNLYTACGKISDGSDECVDSFSGFGDGEIVAMLGNPHNGQNQWGIATDISATRYAALNQTSCEVVFYPTVFVVSVDTVQRIINVSSTENVAHDIDLSSTGSGPANGQLSINVVQEMGLIVQTTTSPRFSQFGNALISNVVNTNFSKINGYLPESLDDSQISLMGIESALEMIVDDILIAFSSAQFVIAAQGGIKQITTNTTVAAIRIGEPSYIYVIVTINAFLLLLFVVAASRNNLWRTLSAFDYRDLKSVVIGSSLGGSGIAVEVLKRKGERHERWNADPGDRVAGRTMVHLNCKEEAMITLSDYTE